MTFETPSKVTTPSYVFSSNQPGIISSNLTFSSSASAIIGNNTITFNVLSDGPYTGKTVTVKNDANKSTTITIPDFVIDTTPPILQQVTAIATSSIVTTPSYVFSSSEAGTISSNFYISHLRASAINSQSFIPLEIIFLVYVILFLANVYASEFAFNYNLLAANSRVNYYFFAVNAAVASYADVTAVSPIF